MRPWMARLKLKLAQGQEAIQRMRLLPLRRAAGARLGGGL